MKIAMQEQAVVFNNIPASFFWLIESDQLINYLQSSDKKLLIVRDLTKKHSNL